MAIQATNYDKDKEYLIAEIKDVPYQNLLINGDFKINQRGQTTYYANGTSWLYTVDMWRINNHSKLYMNDGYIRFHKVDSNQQASINQVVKTEGKSITVIKVKEINGTATVRFGNSTVSKTITQKGIFTIKNDVPISSVAIDLVTNGHYIDIEYIDLFEGDIAYPHVEEDDAIALTRCKRFFIKGTFPAIVSYRNSNSHLSYICRIYFDKMREIPTCGSLQVAGYNESASIITNNSFYRAVQVYNGVVTCFPVFSQNIQAEANLWADIQLSCEPL